MIAALAFDEIQVGSSASFEHSISDNDIVAFASLSGDQSPLHTDIAYATQSGFSGAVVHGMYLGGLVSRLVGMHLPGSTALLVKETLEFRSPAYSGDTVTVSGTVIKKTDSSQLIEVAVEIRTSQKRIASGSVIVLVRDE